MALDIDAILGETAPRDLTYKQQTFLLPGELPGTTIAPLLKLGVLEQLTELLAADDTAPGEDGFIDAFIATLRARPQLPGELLTALKDAFADLLGDDQAEKFWALRPSVNALFVIAREVIAEYGTELADFFGSAISSSTGGSGSKPTSSSTTDSTPEASGDTPAIPAISVVLEPDGPAVVAAPAAAPVTEMFAPSVSAGS